MRLPRTLWFISALLACTLQVAFACDEGKNGSAPAIARPSKVVASAEQPNDRTVFVSVFLTNSGFVSDVYVVSGPAGLTRAATRAVRQRRYRNWGFQLSKSVRNVMLAVTFPKKAGAPPKIRPWVAGVVGGSSGCVVGGHFIVINLPPPVLPSWLTSWPSVMPILAPDKIMVRVINGNDSQPMPKQSVQVKLLYEKAKEISPPLIIETNADGEAQFSVPEPAPEHLDVRLTATSKYRHCACRLTIDTQKVLDSGVLEIPKNTLPSTQNSNLNAEPKQIVFVVRPFTLFEKMLHPFASNSSLNVEASR